MLRFIKSEHPDVKNLVKRIATTSGTGARLLEEFAKDDPSIRLDDIRLPPGELATRDAIASTKEKELLSQTGDDFELTLLLTQTEALSYAWHLAEVTGENEPEPDTRPGAGRLERGHAEPLSRSVHVVVVATEIIGDELDQDSTKLARNAANRAQRRVIHDGHPRIGQSGQLFLVRNPPMRKTIRHINSTRPSPLPPMAGPPK